MDRFEEGYESGKRNAKYFNSIEEIESRYSDIDDSFIKGFIKAFNAYWNDKLMEMF
jgi:hypothetical protein